LVFVHWDHILLLDCRLKLFQIDRSAAGGDEDIIEDAVENIIHLFLLVFHN